MDQQIEEIFKRFITTSRKMHKFNIQTMMQDKTLKRSEFMIMHMLERQEAKYGTDTMRITDVAKKMHNATSTISPVIQELVEREFVTRITSNEDRRVSMIQLTDKGRAFLKERFREVESQFAEIIRMFGIEKAENFVDLLEEFVQVTENLLILSDKKEDN